MSNQQDSSTEREDILVRIQRVLAGEEQVVSTVWKGVDEQ